MPSHRHSRSYRAAAALLFALLAVIAVGCASSSAARGPGIASDAHDADASVEALVETLSDARDAPPLVSRAPGPVHEALTHQGIRRAERARDALRQANEAGNRGSLSPVELVMHALILEGRYMEACDVDCLETLEIAYRLLALMHEAFGGLLRSFTSVMAQADPDATIDSAPYRAWLEDILARAGERHDWAAAQLLERAHDPRLQSRALIGLAQRAFVRDEHDLALRYHRAAVLSLGGHTTEDDLEYLAERCFHALDRECAERAIARWRELGGDVATDPDRSEPVFDEERRAAQTVWDTPGSGIEAGLRRGEALEELGRFGDARRLYETLGRHHPDDGRPHTRLAVLEFRRSFMGLFDLSGTETGEAMRAHLERASHGRNLGQTYYHLSAMSWWYRMLRAAARGAEGQAAVDGLAAELETLLARLDEFDRSAAVGFGAVTEMYLSILRPTDANIDIMGLVRARVPAVRDRLAADPDHALLYRAALFFASSGDRGLAELVLSLDLPEEDTDRANEPLAVSRARLGIQRALVEGEAGPLFERETSDAETDAVTALLRARSWDELRVAAERLERLAGAASTAEARGRGLNNAAVAWARAGELERARALLSRVERSDHAEAAWFNRLALIPERARGSAWREALAGLAESADARVVTYRAARLYAAMGDRHDLGVDVASARERVEENGLTSEATFPGDRSVGFGYSSRVGVVTTNVTPLPWLMVASD